jgi:TPP-dependent pyruvate/acetoin dehydrogenase alpha subunit
MARDPIARAEAMLRERGVDTGELARVHDEVREEVQAAAETLEQTPPLTPTDLERDQEVPAHV